MFSRQGLESLNSPNGFRHRTRVEYIASESEGCRMCKFVSLAICEGYDENWADDDGLVFRNFRSGRSMGTTNARLPGICGLRGSLESELDNCIITINVFAKWDDPMRDVVRRRPLRRDVQSGNVFAAAKSLINECMNPDKPHKRCQHSRDTALLPTRVLDVGKPEDRHPVIKLRVNETETRAPYLALSYCWGKQPEATELVQPLVLQRDNLKDLVANIRLESLQQSIQDAIFVTRKLGFRYIWVDALCIIQDCRKDKDVKISQMASIYKNAAVTIAASCSENSTDGFLSKKIRPFLPKDSFHIPMSNGKKGTVYLSAEAYEPEHPLDKRGWALQESILSSRILKFSDYELLWQCKEVDLHGVTGVGLQYQQPLEVQPWTIFDEDAEPRSRNLDSHKISLWKTLIQQYTKRDLTDPEDRLRAVTEITNVLKRLWRDTNIHGHWTKWFIELLAWQKPDIDREQERCLKRAPSWSWASLNGTVYYEWRFRIEDAKVKSLTASATELTCRVLKKGDINHEKFHTLSERPDLVDLRAEIPAKRTPN